MIPILFEHNVTSFTGHGLGDLVDCVDCIAKINDTGEYELELSYPRTGRLFSELKINRIIVAKANHIDISREPYQAFRIYGYEKAMNGLVKIKCQHISYDLSNVYILDTTYKNTYSNYYGTAVNINGFNSASQLAQAITNNKMPGTKIPVIVGGTNRFTITANYYDSTTFPNTVVVTEPRSVRSVLFDNDNSLLSRWGGTFHFNNYAIDFSGMEDDGSLYYTIEYGVDLIDLTQEENISDMYTAVLPYYKGKDRRYDGDGTWHGPDSVLFGDIKYASGTFQRHRILTLDLSQYFTKDNEYWTLATSEEGIPDKYDINYVAQLWIDAHGFGTPDINLTVDYAHLGKQEPYLFNIVRVKFPKLGVDASARVSSYTYDVLRERVVEIELGKSRSRFIGEYFGSDYKPQTQKIW